MCEPSGDQNGYHAPEVSGSGRAGRHLGEVAHPDLLAAVACDRDERELPPVGRQGHAELVERDQGILGRRLERGAQRHGRRGRSSQMDDGEARGRGCQQRDEPPGQPLPAAAAQRQRRGHSRLRAGVPDPAQLARHVVGALPAVVRVLLQALLHDVVERGRHHRLHGGDRGRLCREDRRDQARLRLAFERPLRRRHLVEQRSEREDIRARVGLDSLELLGGHVLESPQDCPFLRQRPGLRRHSRQPLDRGYVGTRAREAEIEQLGAGLREHDVSRLEIPVDDSLPVRAAQRIGDLSAVSYDLFHGERTFQQPIGQRLPLDQLHDEELALVLSPDIEERADVRVIERRDCPRLALEAGAELLVHGESPGENLDRHIAAEARVAASIHFAHPASTEGRNDFVRADAAAGQEGHLTSLLQELSRRRSGPGLRLPASLTGSAGQVFKVDRWVGSQIGSCVPRPSSTALSTTRGATAMSSRARPRFMQTRRSESSRRPSLRPATTSPRSA